MAEYVTGVLNLAYWQTLLITGLVEVVAPLFTGKARRGGGALEHGINLMRAGAPDGTVTRALGGCLLHLPASNCYSV